MNQPLLSVVVPCYNAEIYIDKCISSIICQGYSNFEVVLIDDGSTDETGMRCDMWQAKDNRIRVIHKQNEGPSYAYKDGIKHSFGEYIAFVDSDDWIHKDMFFNMMKALLDTNSDIAQCDACFVYEDGRTEHFIDKQKENSMEVVGRVEGALLIIEDVKWRSWFCNKIFKKTLFDDVEFPKDRKLREDFITLELFHKASQSVYLHNEYYFYLQRMGSIVNASNIQDKMRNTRESHDALYGRYLFVKKHPEYGNAFEKSKQNALQSGIILLNVMIKYPQYFSEDYHEKAKELRAISLTNAAEFRRDLKIYYYLLKFTGPEGYKFIGSFYVLLTNLINKLK